MIVFAFDRDWTVDVNPHPERQAVPLEWVRRLEAETDHPVYAIGNQQLTDEAAVPGVEEIVERHPDGREQWLGAERPDGRFERYPTRRERLSLVADLHPTADRYVVVDDLDLSAVEGWDHYHAWEFVPAVRAGRLDPELPWADREVRTDGGTPAGDGRARDSADACETVDAIAPDDLEELRAFLADHDAARAFELHYWDKRGDPRYVTALEVIERTVQRPAAAVSLRCVGLPYGTGTLTVRFDQLTRVAVVDAPDDLFAVAGETPGDRASALRDQARADPGAVDLPTLVDVLTAEDPAVREDALSALGPVAETRPADCVATLPALRGFLDAGEQATETLDVLASLAEATPADVAPFADDIAVYLEAGGGEARAAACCLSSVAARDPGDVVDTVPELASLVEEGLLGRNHALYTLGRIADEHPDAVRPAAPALKDVIGVSSLPDAACLHAVAALGRLTAEDPDVALDAIEDLCALLAADDVKLRANAAGVLSDLATVHAGALVPHVDDLAPLLDAEDDYLLVNTTAALARVAEVDPEPVRDLPLADRFVDCLEHDHDLVRLNACWALGHLGAEAGLERLEAVRLRDEDARVRNRAAWAIAEIEGWE